MLMNTPHFTNTNIVSKKWTRKAYNPYPISPNTHTHTHPLSFGREEGKKSPKMSLLHHLVGSIAFLLKVLFFCSLVVALNEVLEDCINSRQVANCIVLFFFFLLRGNIVFWKEMRFLSQMDIGFPPVSCIILKNNFRASIFF